MSSTHRSIGDEHRRTSTDCRPLERRRARKDGLGRGESARSIATCDRAHWRVAGVPYAVIGGNAVAAWVSKVDPGCGKQHGRCRHHGQPRRLRTRVKAALEGAGFRHYELMDVHMFLDGPNGRPRDAVHLLFAGEKVQQAYSAPAPDSRSNRRARVAQAVGPRTARRDEAHVVPRQRSHPSARHDRSRHRRSTPGSPACRPNSPRDCKNCSTTRTARPQAVNL